MRTVTAPADGRRAKCTARDQKTIQESRARHSAERRAASESFLPPRGEAALEGEGVAAKCRRSRPELRRMGDIKTKATARRRYPDCFPACWCWNCRAWP